MIRKRNIHEITSDLKKLVHALSRVEGLASQYGIMKDNSTAAAEGFKKIEDYAEKALTEAQSYLKQQEGKASEGVDGCCFITDDIVDAIINEHDMNVPDELLAAPAGFGAHREAMKAALQKIIPLAQQGKRAEGELSELEKRIINAACGVVAADTYVHPIMSRADAVKAGVAELHDAVNAYYSAQPAVSAKPQYTTIHHITSQQEARRE